MATESTWQGRSLDNYKEMHAKKAKEKGVSKEFQAAKTLTQAREILFQTHSNNRENKARRAEENRKSRGHGA